MCKTVNVNIILPLWFGETDEEAERRLEMMRKAAEAINKCLEEGKFPNIDENADPLPLSLKRIVLDIDMPLGTHIKHSREGGNGDAERPIAILLV